jgi:hypothetical protein
MIKPHVLKKMIQFDEDEWSPVYFAAKRADLDPHEFIRRAALSAAGAVPTVKAARRFA